MAEGSNIEWTDDTWNPTRGCSRVSPGCMLCYAEQIAYRFSGPGKAFEGLVQIGGDGKRRPVWNGVMKFVEKAVALPLKWGLKALFTHDVGGGEHHAGWRRRRIFVNSMSDLFHDGVTDAELDRVYAVMWLAQRHDFQILTKRTRRMRKYLECLTIERLRAAANLNALGEEGTSEWPNLTTMDARGRKKRFVSGGEERAYAPLPFTLPLPNVWHGVSAERQEEADERVGHLLLTPSAKRFVSYEPSLGIVDWKRIRHETDGSGGPCYIDALRGIWYSIGGGPFSIPRLDWLIAGGESGKPSKVRPCNVEGLRQAVKQCLDAGVAVFVKQLGTRPFLDGVRMKIAHKKGANMAEWPSDLQVRQYPE